MTEYTVVSALLVMLFVAVVIAFWAFVKAGSALVAAEKAESRLRDLPDVGELKRQVGDLSNIERKMAELVENKVDRLFAAALGSPMLLEKVDISAIPTVMEKIREKILEALEEPSDDLRLTIEKTVSVSLLTDNVRVKIQEALIRKLEEDADDIVGNVLDSESDSYSTLLDAVEKWIPIWLEAELQNQESPFRKQLIESIGENLQNTLNGE